MSEQHSAPPEPDQQLLPEGPGTEAAPAPRLLNPRFGVLCALGAYGLWGFLPLYFHALKTVPPLEMLAWRVVFSLVLCLLIITVTRSWGKVLAAFRNLRVNLTLALAGAVVSVNWLVYIIATTTGHVLEASLGYFINPLATILLGVLVLHERLRRLQWAAVAMGVLAVLVISVNYGSPPWLSLLIAGSFACYGLIKNSLGGKVDGVTGLSFETAWLTLPAVVVLFLTDAGTLGGGGGLSFSRLDGLGVGLLIGAGAVTAVPLLFFAGAANNLPLSTVGMFQYITPITQFLIGWAVFGEEMPLARWLGFVAVWIAVLMLLFDAARTSGASRRAARRAS